MNLALLSVENFILAALYALVISGITFLICRVLERLNSPILAWREFWLVASSFALLPIIIGIFPSPLHHLSQFDVSSLSNVFVTATNTHVAQIATPTVEETFVSFSNILSGLSLIYLIGLCFCLVRFVSRLVYLNRMLKCALPVSPALATITPKYYRYLIRVAKTCKLQIVLTEQCRSPFIVQGFSSKLVLPISLFDKLSEQQIRLVIRHEWIHKKNGDGLIQILLQLLLCINWFNPVCYWVINRTNWATEANCDFEVLSGRRNLQRTYALAMLQILRRSATNLSHQPVAAFSSQSHRSITMRIKHIMDPSAKSFKSFFSRLGLTLGSSALSIMALSLQPTLHAEEAFEMVNPVVKAKVSSSYGMRNKFHKFHHGIDLAAKEGTPIVAAASGKVIVSTEKLKGRKNYGTVIIIEHGNGYQTVYSHLSQLRAFEGDYVEKGQLIGLVGQTGRATGPHLHLEILKDKKSVDPAAYINFKS